MKYFVWGAMYRGAVDRPRVVEAHSFEEAVEKFIRFKRTNLTSGTFLAVPIEGVKQITVKPRREFDIFVDDYLVDLEDEEEE